jgi:hypothetical protein
LKYLQAKRSLALTIRLGVVDKGDVEVLHVVLVVSGDLIDEHDGDGDGELVLTFVK